MPKGPDYESYGNIALAHIIANLLEANKYTGQLNPEQLDQLAEAFAEMRERVSSALADR